MRNFKNAVAGLGLDFLFGESFAEQQEHVIAEIRVGRVVGASRVAVNAEGLAYIDVFAHLDRDVLGVFVEQVQDRHERHGGVHVVLVATIDDCFVFLLVAFASGVQKRNDIERGVRESVKH